MNIFSDIARAYINKVTNKLWGTVRMPAKGRKKGYALVSYITGPFTLTPWEHFTDPHTNYQECAEIVRLLTIRGYTVDIISANNTYFIPRKPYALIIDTAQNLERLSPFLSSSCKKVMHITSSYNEFQNNAERTRLDNLRQRHNTELRPQRPEHPSDNPAYADFLEGFGNKTVLASYAKFNKTIYPIPISVAQTFDFPSNKDFMLARTHFLFFGGGGAILKGLDLVLEAFADLPDLSLHIIGPAAYEKDFEKLYAKELALPNINRYPRPRIDVNGNMDVGGIPFSQVANMCATMIYPSASEGTSGAVIQTMHAGVIPICTKETGISENAPIIIMETPTIESIKRHAQNIASTDPKILKDQALRVWEYARTHHTLKTFSAAYARFIDNTLHI